MINLVKELPLVAQTVKNLPAIQETLVQSLGQEDPLKKGITTHSSTLAWRIPWTEKPDGLSSWGCKQQDTTKHTGIYETCICRIKICFFRTRTFWVYSYVEGQKFIKKKILKILKKMEILYQKKTHRILEGMEPRTSNKNTSFTETRLKKKLKVNRQAD